MELVPPYKGLNVGAPASKQPPGTSRDLNNVRPIGDGKFLIWERPGTTKVYTQQIGGDAAPIIAMLSISTVD